MSLLRGTDEPGTSELPPGHRAAADDKEPLFERSRLLATLGSALFGMTTVSLLKHHPAWAAHQAPPGPCYGFGRCHACSGSTCTLPECVYIHWEGCPGGGQCWANCYNGCVWNCCDWHNTNSGVHCICGTCVQNSHC